MFSVYTFQMSRQPPYENNCKEGNEHICVTVDEPS